ncbi:MAG: hypothetical protein IIZ78_20130 [Clostridiales bacterium]|nr:hypothetical protein [Clostridiales bacterium]
MEIKTKSGFKCKVNENRVKDWRYIKTSSKIAKSKDDMEIINGIDFLMSFLLGEEYERLMEHLAEDGIVDSSTLIATYKEITERIGEQLKKSNSSQG